MEPHPQHARPVRSVTFWALGTGLVLGWVWAGIDFAIAYQGGLSGGILPGWLLFGVLAAIVPWSRARGVGLLRMRHGRLKALGLSAVSLVLCWLVAAVGLLSLWAMAFSGGA
ncbi:MAG: hypothetical protein LKF98_03450 [Microbacteriaceae bacterium]|nr:hypothetical protein [Microbacteriaceae bacterium]